METNLVYVVNFIHTNISLNRREAQKVKAVHSA